MKKLLVVLLILQITLFLSACVTSTTTLSTTTDATTDTFTTSILTTASETTTTTSSCKAVNYDYDEASLTYQLVWYDEFAKETGVPSIIKWKYQTGGGGWGNDELQYYTNGANSIIQSDHLVIEARKETFGEEAYTSSRMNTGMSFLYGKFSIRAKLPQGAGTWPAIWMMPQSSSYGAWPKSGEIDIMEHVGTDMGRVHFSIHTEKYYHKIGTQKTSVTTVASVASTYHVYTLEWLPDKLKFFVDDVLKWTYDPTDFVACPTSQEWPFDRPFYLILNVAIGGWGGTPYAGFVSESMTIDYVRIYQADEL